MSEPALPDPPRGWQRRLFRAPIWLYRWHLGWLLGQRFLLLRHLGRKSGLWREVVVEVVRHDEGTDSYIVASGYGDRSQWYRNLVAHPAATIQVGRREGPVTAELLTPEEGADEMADYAQRHPRAAWALGRKMGYVSEATEAAYRAAGRRIPFVAFRPRDASSAAASAP